MPSTIAGFAIRELERLRDGGTEQVAEQVDQLRQIVTDPFREAEHECAAGGDSGRADGGDSGDEPAISDDRTDDVTQPTHDPQERRSDISEVDVEQAAQELLDRLTSGRNCSKTDAAPTPDRGCLRWRHRSRGTG